MYKVRGRKKATRGGQCYPSYHVGLVERYTVMPNSLPLRQGIRPRGEFPLKLVTYQRTVFARENMGIVETNHRLDDNGLVWDRLNSSTRVNPKSDS